MSAVRLDLVGGVAHLGDQSVAIEDAPQDGLTVEGWTIRPLDFGERDRSVRGAADVAASVLAAASLEAGPEPSLPAEILALHLAGADPDRERRGFDETLLLVARRSGWTPTEILATEARLVDRLADEAVPPDVDAGGWRSVVFRPPDAPTPSELREQLAADFRRRASASVSVASDAAPTSAPDASPRIRPDEQAHAPDDRETPEPGETAPRESASTRDTARRPSHPSEAPPGRAEAKVSADVAANARRSRTSSAPVKGAPRARSTPEPGPERPRVGPGRLSAGSVVGAPRAGASASAAPVAAGEIDARDESSAPPSAAASLRSAPVRGAAPSSEAGIGAPSVPHEGSRPRPLPHGRAPTANTAPATVASARPGARPAGGPLVGRIDAAPGVATLATPGAEAASRLASWTAHSPSALDVHEEDEDALMDRIAAALDAEADLRGVDP
jgi:hypothetical protein